MSKAVELIEIDLPYCTRSYGIAPCTAAIGVTGADKCFNSPGTCQDIPNFFTVFGKTIRWTKPAEYLDLPRKLSAIPSIKEIDFTPSTVSLGENLGSRAVLRVVFKDHKDSDAVLDKYASERLYDPYNQGSYWPKFRARWPSLQGARLRWRIGFDDWVLSDYETRHFFIESFDGPTADGTFTITAKDSLKFLDGDRAQAPILSSSTLGSTIDETNISITLLPAGIGNAEYPISGYARIGGKEDVSFTRSNDTMTIVRGQLGTTAQDHSSGDRVQLVLRYPAQTPAEIANHLLTNYTDLPSSYIPLSEWEEECGSFLGVVYNFVIGEPTPVKTILDRLIEQAGLAMWDDPLNQKLRMKVIRSVPITAQTVADDRVIAGAFDLADQTDKRVSRCWVYYAQNDPTKRHDDIDNYRAVVKVEDIDSEFAYGPAAIKKIFASGIAAGGAALAARLAYIVTGRYRSPPRRIKFGLFRGTLVPELGEGVQINWRTLQDASGAVENVPAQVVRFKPSPAIQQIEVEEMRYVVPPEGEIDPDIHNIIVNFNTVNINVRTMHDSLYGVPVSGQTVNFIVQLGAIVGSTYGNRAIEMGSFPAGVTVNVVLSGRLQGAGGQGGGAIASQVGLPGMVALYTRTAIQLAVNVGGELWGGAGGGGMGIFTQGGPVYNMSGGGGGAGTDPGPGGARNAGAPSVNPTSDGSPGTSTGGGSGGPGVASNTGRGGDGGGPGLPGQAGWGGDFPGVPGTGHAAGAAGAAIDGVSFVTKGTWNGSTITPGTLAGDVRGPEIN